MPRLVPRSVVAVLLAVGALLGAAAPSLARGGDDEVRTSGTCGSRASAELRLKADDGTIEARFEVRGARAGSWRVVAVQERRVAWRGTVRADRGSRSFRVQRTLVDLPGADAILFRAVGPRGVTCSATGTLSGS
jgi:hypothetical protein